MNFQLSPSCANLHHTINLPAWFYMCCYVRLTLFCTQCMFVYFHILHWKYNHSTLSFVSLTNVVYVTRNLSGKVLSNLGWVRALWDSPAPIFMVSQGDVIKTKIAVSSSSILLLDQTKKDKCDDAKRRVNKLFLHFFRFSSSSLHKFKFKFKGLQVNFKSIEWRFPKVHNVSKTKDDEDPYLLWSCRFKEGRGGLANLHHTINLPA